MTRPDIEVAGAAATALAVRLDDLFDVRVIPATDGTIDDDGAGIDRGEWNPLGLERSHRLNSLLALRDERDLDDDESAELQSLVDRAGHAIIERGIQEIARTRGESVDHVRAEIMANVERLSNLWGELEADPARMAEAVREAKARRRTTLLAKP